MHRQTIRLAACGTFLLLTAASCQRKEAGRCDRPARQTIVFYDQSASSVADPATLAMFGDTMNALVQSGLECHGDAVRGFLVHERTRSKAERVDVENRVPPLGDTLRMSTLIRSQAVLDYNQRTDSLRADGAARLASLFTMNVAPEYRRHTDLIGTLEVIGDEVAKADSGSTIRVVYLGDMHESMPPPRRDFDRQPPATIDEAEAWANADTVVLRDLRVDRDQLARVEVRVLLGSLALRPAAPEIRRYWERLFANAGIPKVQYN